MGEKKKKIVIVTYSIAIRIAGKVSRYIDALSHPYRPRARVNTGRRRTANLTCRHEHYRNVNQSESPGGQCRSDKNEAQKRSAKTKRKNERSFRDTSFTRRTLTTAPFGNRIWACWNLRCYLWGIITYCQMKSLPAETRPRNTYAGMNALHTCMNALHTCMTRTDTHLDK